eukprot:gene8712-33704_t
MAAGTGADDTGIEALEEIPTNEAAVEIKCMLQGTVNGARVTYTPRKSQGKCTNGDTVLGASVKDQCAGACVAHVLQAVQAIQTSCTDLTFVNGQAVCSSCCNSWKSQGKRTDGSNVLGGANPKNTVCRGRCGSC